MGGVDKDAGDMMEGIEKECLEALGGWMGGNSAWKEMGPHITSL